MNASVANTELHLMPAGLGYRSTLEGAARVEADARREAGRGLGRKLADGIAWLLAMPRRRAVLSELNTLSDRELFDIGISRCDLKRVFDPSFAREHALRSTAYRPGLNA